MRRIALTSLLLLLGLAACTTEAAGKPGATAQQALDGIRDALAGITSPETAQAAKDKLMPLIEQASGALTAVKGVASDAGGLGDAAKNLADKASEALTPQIKDAMAQIAKQVDRLASNPELKGALGDAMTKLSDLVK